MRKNVITKSKKQISLEERIAREQEKLQELNAVMEARKQKLEGRLRQLISAEFTKNLEDFADFADDELEAIIKAAMNSKDCKDKIEEYRKASEGEQSKAGEVGGQKARDKQKKLGQPADKSKEQASKDVKPTEASAQPQTEQKKGTPALDITGKEEVSNASKVKSMVDARPWSN